MKSDAPTPKRRPKPLLAGPTRLVGKALPRRSRFRGYRAQDPDLVCQNACDGFEVLLSTDDATAVRGFGASAKAATTREQLLELWAQVPEPLRPLLQRAFELAERERRWPAAEKGPDPGLYVRGTTSAIDRFFGSGP